MVGGRHMDRKRCQHIKGFVKQTPTMKYMCRQVDRCVQIKPIVKHISTLKYALVGKWIDGQVGKCKVSCT